MSAKIEKTGQKHFLVKTGTAGLHAGTAGRDASITDYSLDHESIRFSEKELLSGLTGIEQKNIVMLNQVHGSDVIDIRQFPDENLPAQGEADGFITAMEGMCLVIRTADCVPVFIYDSRKGVLGAVHSGWKGTMLDITGRCIAMMKDGYGCSAGDMHVFILPSIGPEMYEVNEDVAQYFPDERIDRDGRIFVDLWKNIESSCERQGVGRDRIFNSSICNRTEHGEFFSHRFGDRGRNINFAYIGGE